MENNNETINKNIVAQAFSKKTTFLTILVCAALILLIACSYYFISQWRKGVEQALNAERTRSLVPRYGASLGETNQDYAKAKVALGSGNLEEGVEYLNAARQKYATGTQEWAVIGYDTGIAYAFSKDPIKALEQFKSIYLDEVNYPALVRSMAVEGLGRTYWASHDKNLLVQTFSGDPYFNEILKRVGGNYNEALWSLVEEAYKKQPTPISSARLAQRIAAKITAPGVDTQSQNEYRNNFAAYIIEADKEIEAYKKNQLAGSGVNGYVAEFYSIKAEAIGNMLLIKQEVPYKEEDVIKLYKDAYDLANDSLKPFILYKYGVFMARSNPQNQSKVEELGARLAALSPQSLALFRNFIISSSKNGQETTQYRDRTAFMRDSPSFEKYVKSLTGN